jgi:hypothetical protein
MKEIPMSQNETQIYSGHGVEITSRRVLLPGGTTVAISQINSVQTHMIPGGNHFGKGLIIGAVLIVGASAIEFYPGGIAGFFVAAIIGRLSKKRDHHSFIMDMSGGSTRGQFCPDAASARQAADALSEAIVQNQVAAAEERQSNSSSTQAGGAPAASVSVADEIMKFKGLLDAGVISQEEFDQKKKQLLGI